MGGQNMKDIANKFKKKTETPIVKEIKGEPKNPTSTPKEKTPTIKDEAISSNNYYIKLKKELKGKKITKSKTVYVDEKLMHELQMIKAITGIPISVFATSIIQKELKKHEKDYKEYLSKNL